MKKLLSFLLGTTILLGLFGFSYACEEIDIYEWERSGSSMVQTNDLVGSVCIDIDKYGNTYELSTEVSNYQGAGTPSLRCSYQLPSGEYGEAGECNGNFVYNSNRTSNLKLYIWLNEEYGEIYEYYDFDDGERSDDSSSSNNDLDEFDFYYVEDDSPDKDERTTVRIKALDDNGDRIYDYDNEVTLHFDRDGYDADEYDLRIRSNDFSEEENDLDSNGELDVDFDDGYLRFEVWFDYEDDYTITVEDGYVDAEQDFDVGDNYYSNNDLDEFDFYYVEDDSPDKDERTTVRIKALDDDGDRIYDYDNEVTLHFDRDGYDADEYDLRIRSNDFSEEEDDLDSNGELDVYFDDGYLRFEVWFEYEDDYTITVEDGYVDAEQDFDVGDNYYSNNDLDEFDFYYVEDDSPDKDERTTVRIKALDDDGDRIYDYDNEVTLHFDRDGYDADEYDLRIRSNDFSEEEDDLDSNGELDVYFDDGYLRFEVWFEYEDDYTITVEDGYVDTEQDFDVGDDGSQNSNVDGFTNDEFETIERIYDVRPRLISQLQIENRDLRNDDNWDDMSDELYDNMKDIIDDSYNKEFDNYDEFFDAFEDWYSYTLDVIH